MNGTRRRGNEPKPLSDFAGGRRHVSQSLCFIPTRGIFSSPRMLTGRFSCSRLTAFAGLIVRRTLGLIIRGDDGRRNMGDIRWAAVVRRR
jgi:hypothetical protein